MEKASQRRDLDQEGTNTGLDYWNGLLDWYIGF